MALDERKDARLRDIFPRADKAVRFLCTTDRLLAEVRYTMRDAVEMFAYRDRGSTPVTAPCGNCGGHVQF